MTPEAAIASLSANIDRTWRRKLVQLPAVRVKSALAVVLAIGIAALAPASAQQISSPAINYNFGFTFPNVAAGTTNFAMTGDVAVNSNAGALVSVNTTISNLYVKVSVAPATAQQAVFTVFAGPPTPGNVIATTLTCTIPAAAFTCSDTTHSFVLPAGQEWTLQAVTGATNNIGQSMASVLMTN